MLLTHIGFFGLQQLSVCGLQNLPAQGRGVQFLGSVWYVVVNFAVTLGQVIPHLICVSKMFSVVLLLFFHLVLSAVRALFHFASPFRWTPQSQQGGGQGGSAQQTK